MLYTNLKTEHVFRIVDSIYQNVRHSYPDYRSLYDRFDDHPSITIQLCISFDNRTSIFYQTPTELRSWMPKEFSIFSDLFVTNLYRELLSIVVSMYSYGNSLSIIKENLF